tara:strand:+ start:189 stop:431 length:243 start_codon:yes stop_codon:yes gene_type:complete
MQKFNWTLVSGLGAVWGVLALVAVIAKIKMAQMLLVPVLLLILLYLIIFTIYAMVDAYKKQKPDDTGSPGPPIGDTENKN